MHRIALLCLAVPMLALAGDGADAGTPPAAPSVSASGSPFAEMDALWDTRDAPGAETKLLQLTGDGVKDHPEDFEYLYRSSRIRLWVADGEADQDRKKQLAKEAWDLGDKAAKVKPASVIGFYFAAAGLGSYSQAVGILNALAAGLESKFNERLDKAIAIDPNFAHAGPLAVKGRYFYELPWPKRNLRKSADWLKKALAADPTALRPLVWLADTQFADGDKAAARDSLAKLEAGSMPSDPPEERRCKALGKKLAQQMDKER